MSKKRKLTRREAALVQQARRDAIEEFERKTVGIISDGNKVVFTTIADLRTINRACYKADDLMIRIHSVVLRS